MLALWTLPAAAKECDELDYTGECHGDEARWCENGKVKEVDCEDAGKVCGWNEEKGYFDCVSAKPPCEMGVTYEGACIDGTLVWCQDGAPRSLQCHEGTECAWSEADQYFDCVSVASGRAPAPGEAPDEQAGQPENEYGNSDESADEWDDGWQRKPARASGSTIDAIPPEPAGVEPGGGTQVNEDEPVAPARASEGGCAAGTRQTGDAHPWYIVVAAAALLGIRRFRAPGPART
jgi:hypothetical protein